MENSVLIIVAVVFFVLFLIVYFVRQNIKDKKELEKTLNNDYKKFDYSDDNQNKSWQLVKRYAKNRKNGFVKFIPFKFRKLKEIKLTSINEKART